jgi:hypothetical protein
VTLSKTLFATAAVAALAGVTGAQYTSEAITNNYTDISGTGTLIIDVGDDDGVAVNFFSFDFFGTAITSISASTNGYLTTGADITDFSNDCIPNGTDPNGHISPFWDDYTLDDHGDMYAQVDGAAGSQVLTVQWHDVGGFNNSFASYNFQVKLYEGSNDIEFHYGTIDGAAAPSDGSDQTIGVENDAGDAGHEVSCDTAIDLTSGYRVFVPAVQPAVLDAPAGACIGGSVDLSGSGEPGNFYGIAVSASNGPTGPLSLGPDYVNNIISTGIIGMDGTVGPFTVPVPATLDCGFCGYAQMVTIGSFGPLGDISLSDSLKTTFTDCSSTQSLAGALDADALTSDLYEMSALAGESITIALCRVGDQPDGSSLLDPRLCVYQGSIASPTGTGVVTDDDGGGDCFTTGPFGASLITDWSVPATDTYTIAASAWGATEGPYELSVTGGCAAADMTVVLVGDEVTGGCFN